MQFPSLSASPHMVEHVCGPAPPSDGNPGSEPTSPSPNPVHHPPGKGGCFCPHLNSGRLAKPYSGDATQSSGPSELGRREQGTKADSCPPEALAPSPGWPLWKLSEC